jgi:hypothetical protein
MEENRTIVPSSPGEITDYYGRVPDPNPGERAESDDASGVPIVAVSPRPARGNRAGGGQQIDVGAVVGIRRNLEFTAGGRAHRMITGTHSNARPTLDPKTGRMHTSTASDTGEPSLGGREADQPAMASQVEGAGATNDTSTGDTTPDRQRDRKTT